MLPHVPYGWLPKGKQTGIKADNRRVINLFGLMSLDQKLTVYPTTKSINAQFIIKALNSFAVSIQKPTVIVLDQAPWHTAQDILDQIEKWQQKQLYLFFLPTYSPQLNAIEILWRFIKYKWLKPQHYTDAKTLKEAILDICRNFGDSHCINFSKNFLLLE